MTPRELDKTYVNIEMLSEHRHPRSNSFFIIFYIFTNNNLRIWARNFGLKINRARERGQVILKRVLIKQDYNARKLNLFLSVNGP